MRRTHLPYTRACINEKKGVLQRKPLDDLSKNCELEKVYLQLAVCFCIIRLYRYIFNYNGKQIEQATLVLQLLKDFGLSLNLENLAFFTNRAGYYGNFLRLGLFEVADRTADTIRDLKTPKDATELRFFLASGNLFRIFMQDLLTVVAPIIRGLKRTQIKDPVHL